MALTHNNTELATTNNLWESTPSLQEIREIYKKNLSEGEFKTFIQLGKATGLNPFLKEIWAVKYGDAPAQIFIGRDGYRKSAQRNPLYDFHRVDAVYSNDEFGIDSGRVMHRYKLSDRGKLLGAYCEVKRKGASNSIYVYVDLPEYNKGQSVWKDKPATMIKKVAEAQALRMAFQELFAGTYAEEEQWDEKPKVTTRIIEAEQEKDPFELDDLRIDGMNYMADISTVETLFDLKTLYEEIKNKPFKAKDPELYKNLIKAVDEKRKMINESLTEENEAETNG